MIRMANEAHIAQLIVRKLRHDISAVDIQRLESWQNESPSNRRFLEEETREEAILETLSAAREVRIDTTWEKFELLKHQHLLLQQRVPMIRRYRRLAAAAVFIVLAGACAYLWNRSTQEGEVKVVTAPFLVAAPVSQQNAVLTLPDGSSVEVNPAVTGGVALQGGLTTTMQEDGRLVFNTDLLSYIGVSDLLFRKDMSAPTVQYSTLQVPLGTKYELTLPDGTDVIVNAGSTLKFPVNFAGNTREVALSGEAYFDVRPDAKHPFNVLAGNKRIEVLGTRFAVRNYATEPVKTVILKDGKVRVHNRQQTVELSPNEEALVDDEDQSIKIMHINADKSLSWKDGYFNFDGLDLRAAICQMAQWHGMKVQIEKDVKVRSLGSGNIAHSIPLPRLLKLLELPELHFEIHDSTIIVKK